MKGNYRQATGIPLEEFSRIFTEQFDRMWLETKGAEVYGVWAGNAGMKSRKLKDSPMVLDVIGGRLKLPIKDLCYRNGMIWCIGE